MNEDQRKLLIRGAQLSIGLLFSLGYYYVQMTTKVEYHSVLNATNESVAIEMIERGTIATRTLQP
ncbi:MAG: hypothetical protein AAF542_22620 [Pseudomonadota bacterium]